MRDRVQAQWDRMAVYLIFVFFGVYSLFRPLVSLGNAVPRFFETLFSVEFIVSGASLALGLILGTRWLRQMGLSVAFIGLLTVSGVIGAAGQWRTLAYAALIAAFGFTCLVELRRVRKKPSSSLADLQQEVISLAEDATRQQEEP